MEADTTALGLRRFEILLAFLDVLADLEEEPLQDTATTCSTTQLAAGQISWWTDG